MRVMVAVVMAALAGCAGPGEIRDTGFKRALTVRGQAEAVAGCVANQLDDALAPFGSTARAAGAGRTVLTRSPDRTVAVTDLVQKGSEVEVRISIGPAVFPADRMAGTIEKAVRACGA